MSLTPTLRQVHPWSMSPRLVASLLLGLALGGCSRKPRPEETVDGWSMSRKALTSGQECFAGRPEYCITDPAFVDAAIKPRLDDLYGGEMPLRKLYVDAIVRAAINEYRRAMMKPESITKVEQLVKERYDNPKVEIKGDEVAADMGVVPGRIEPSIATLGLRLTKSELIDLGSWKEDEARRVLALFAKKYPDKTRVRVSVSIVTAHGMETESYLYLRNEKRLVVYLGDHARSTGVLAEGDGALTQVPLALDGLMLCKEVGAPPNAPECPLLEKPAEPVATDP